MSRERRRPPRHPQRRRSSHSGQSVVEFALIAPLMIIIMLAVVDMARVYTTMLTVESAARESADYGSFGSQRWDPSLYDVPTLGTKDQMKLRACTAASNLPDYVGPDANCTNPTFSFELSGDKGATWTGDPATITPLCNDLTRKDADDPVTDPPPCWVKVNLHYDFHLIAPLNVDFFGVSLGLPNTLSFDRQSIFPVTDLHL